MVVVVNKVNQSVFVLFCSFCCCCCCCCCCLVKDILDGRVMVLEFVFVCDDAWHIDNRWLRWTSQRRTQCNTWSCSPISLCSFRRWCCPRSTSWPCADRRHSFAWLHTWQYIWMVCLVWSTDSNIVRPRLTSTGWLCSADRRCLRWCPQCPLWWCCSPRPQRTPSLQLYLPLFLSNCYTAFF